MLYAIGLEITAELIRNREKLESTREKVAIYIIYLYIIYELLYIVINYM